MPERTEYRVVGENEANERWEQPATTDIREAERTLKRFSTNWNRWIKIQTSTVTEARTPWVDLPESKQGVDRG